MIQLSGVWPQSTNTNKDVWRDEPARAKLDRAAKSLENGDLSGGWEGEEVQVGENRNAELAKKAAGSLVKTTSLLGD
jgi:hypothetical protein